MSYLKPEWEPSTGADKSSSVLTNGRGNVMKKCFRRPVAVMLPSA
jgi:hypothetical protein